MTFVADFTPEQLRNASAGRRYGQRKREAQMSADELDFYAAALARWEQLSDDAVLTEIARLFNLGVALVNKRKP